MPGFVGLPEILLLGLVVLLVFGPKRLPEMGRSLGRGMREFKDSVTNDSNDKNDVDETKLELTAATDTPVVVPERLADRTAA
ncbi:MAG: sec-independent protein translocase protein TatA [Gaiellaceae bacterium]|jgi:sec-independent protein translocase protein TatA|nr:sec-independent protein translocase protein TatA [Gaiellaceae bacterium]